MMHRLGIDRITQRTFSSVELILAVALFVALFSNVSFFAAAIKTVDLSGTGALFIASLFFYIMAIFVLVLSAVCHRRLVKPMLMAFLLISAAITYFTSKYGIVLDHHMIANVMETDAREAADLFNPQLLLYVGFFGLLPSLAVWYVDLNHPDWKTETLARLKLVAAAGATLVAVHLAFGAHYASFHRENRAVVSMVNPTYALYSAFKYASRSLNSRSMPHVAVAPDARKTPEDRHRELVIMVVGETVRADHWGLNGYHRDTTPLLRREEVINFANFWSCDTSTAKSVPCMFSHLGRKKFDAATARNYDNALDILKRTGVSVLWRDNNSSSKGVADEVEYEDFSTPAKNPVCEEQECRDEGMLHGLKAYIDKQPGDVLIVLHQMGNHGPAYYKRYPAAFEKFAPVCRTNDLGACSYDEISNAFDNAILYTDYFLSKVIGLLKEYDDTFETAMLYVSDHGESLGEYGLYLHATPYLFAPEAQRHVPAIIWLGNSIRHDVDLRDIQQRQARAWSHDNIFATLLGFFEIRSGAYNPYSDLLERAKDEHAKSHQAQRPDDLIGLP